MLCRRIAIGITSVLFGLALAPPASLAASGSLLSIQIVPERASVYPEGGFAFQAIGFYDDGSARDITRKVSFASSDSDVATFLKKNILLAHEAGTTGITASQGGIVSPSVPFEVSEIESLVIAPDLDALRLGSLFRWSVSAVLENGATGLNVSDLVDWSSGAPQFVSIENAKKKKGLSRGEDLGSAELTASLLPDSVSRSITVVDPANLDSVAVLPATRILQLGDGGGFRAIGNFDGAFAEITLNVDWFSTNAQVATTTKGGAIKVRGFGTTTLSVVDRETEIDSSDSGGNAELIVVGDVQSLSVEPALLALAVGGDDDLEAIASVEGSMSTFTWTGRVQWTSSAPGVASVDDDGNVVCEAMGAAVITARDPRSGKTDTADVTCS